ncbi:MAG TPA: phage tail sheath C-terminal domain-containing protein [Actinoplanes sp.]|jgi:hypothetical protein|nr:phage tail sheath C-terminal domain-containing protein [Actinoplanes sp.]
MPQTLDYPGVYVNEIPSGSRAITGVATSITAFVGRAARGPVDRPVTINSWAEYEQQFGGLWRVSGLGYAIRDFFLNGGGTAIILRLAGGATASTLNAGGLALQAYGPGVWGDRLEVDIAHPEPGDAAEVATAQGVEPDDLFHLTVREGEAEDPDTTESFLNVTVADGPRRVDLVLAGSRLIRVDGNLPATRPAEGTYTVQAAGTGTDSAELTGNDYRGIGVDGDGLDALRQVDLFNLLCLPPSTLTGNLPDDVWADAMGLCVDRNAMLLVDPPSGTVRDDILAWLGARGLSGTSARNAAFYFPRLRAPDPLRGGTAGDFVPCGAVAGVMARTDATRGVWKAPAGTEAGLVAVIAPAETMTDRQNGVLNVKGVNCVRAFRDTGSVVWGARTLRGADSLADEYKYVPVRRIALFLKESLYRGTQWAVFEPNDAPLWAQIRTSLGAFMQDLFRQGAFQGSTPREAYFVKCDAETTTQYDIDRGIVNILVGFAPLKPAEFVVVGIQQKTATATG